MITLEEMAMLSTLYAQSHRFYHNINHINDCLAELEQIPNISHNDRVVIEKAIWYHDAVYNPHSTENEIKSAALLQHNPTTTADHVRKIILATAKHLVTQENISLTTQIMLDIDLCGFGKPWEICKKNADNIRKEYYNTTDLDFYKGRKNFLETIMKRESLYYTDYFRNKYHKQSRENLEAEMKLTEWQLSRLTAETG